MSEHAYAHMIGQTVGLAVDGVGIVPATVMTPEIGQNDNFLLVQREDTVWEYVRWNAYRRADFVNASLLD